MYLSSVSVFSHRFEVMPSSWLLDCELVCSGDLASILPLFPKLKPEVVPNSRLSMLYMGLLDEPFRITPTMHVFVPPTYR